MSIKIMSRVWDLKTDTHTQKLVLLALADNANDEGYCWPSLPTVARKSELTERAVRENLRILEDKKLLRTQFNQGRSSSYFLTIPTPEPGSPLPRNPVPHTPEPHSGGPRNQVPPEPSVRTVIEPSGEPSGKNGGQKPNPPRMEISSSQRISFEKELERAMSERSTIQNNYGPMQSWCKDDLERSKVLRVRIVELKAILGCVV